MDASENRAATDGVSDVVPDSIPDEKTIVLRSPVTLGTGADAVTYTEIVLREPKVHEIEKFMKKLRGDSEVGAMKYFIALISGVLPTVIDQIGARDFQEAQAYLDLFFRTSGSPATGDS